MICLGIESTAHTFSVGIMTDEGEILGIASSLYRPHQGGLKPADVVEHHYNCYEHILQSAIHQANISFKDLNLISFSQGPGLGPCLRIGAAVARSLSQKLNIPIVGVNHCIAHIEIGRKLCNVDDPITLYVSGGNTIISAFDSGHYQIFGETLDLSIGNLIDMVAREIDIPHPGGPKIELLAKKGKKYYSLPYIVKGMDLSYSGLFSTMRRVIKSLKTLESYTIEDLVFSLQETAFSMLAEVCERALAHTEKKSVLLTGGVAANKRLQEMIHYISEEHNAKFYVVPLKVAGDNGAMIAWAGIEQYRSNLGMKIIDTKILPKWRMDEVLINWRKDPTKFVENSIIEESLSISQDFGNLFSNTFQFRKGAEAQIYLASWMNREVLIKHRGQKAYRISEIDREIRSQRTLVEGKALMDLLKFGIPVPLIFQILPSEGIIIMKKINGSRLKDKLIKYNNSELKSIFFKIGCWIAQIHQADHIHGDLTTSNIIITKNKDLFFIDFGLSRRDIDIEEKAMDLHLFNRCLKSTHGNYYHLLYPEFIRGYRSGIPNSINKILARVDIIELRGRYIAKDKRRK